MREVSRHLFIPRRPLIASMLASDPERSWIRIVKASLITSTRPALTSASAPFAMTRRCSLPAEPCALRPGNVHSADGWEAVLKPVVARYQGKVSRIYFRADAGFANPEVYEYLAD